MARDKTYVVIGNSASGIAALEAMRKNDKRSRIINISKEPHRPYSRCLLSYYLADQYKRDILWIRPEDFYSRLNIEPLLNTAVTAIDIKKRSLSTSADKKIPFDKLLIATGASAKPIDVKGAKKSGVFTLRTLKDADDILEMLPRVKSACILGGGLLGMRAAYALKRRGVNVHVIVKSSHIFSQMLDMEAADIVREHLEANGIEISTGLAAGEIIGKDEAEGIILDDGNVLPCGLIVVAKGAEANLDIVKSEVKTGMGIKVDEYLRTDRDDIFASGDVAETYDIFQERPEVNQIWPAAVRQGKIAGQNMTGQMTRYEGSYGMNSLDFFDLAFISFGLFNTKESEGYEELIRLDTKRVAYRKIVLKDNRIVGGILINDVERHGILLHLALERVDISDIKDALVDEYFDFGKVIPLIKRQPGSFARPEYKDAASSYSPLY